METILILGGVLMVSILIIAGVSGQHRRRRAEAADGSTVSYFGGDSGCDSGSSGDGGCDGGGGGGGD